MSARSSLVLDAAITPQPAATCHTRNGKTVIYIHRAYTHLDSPQFSLTFPPQLDGRIDPKVLANTVQTVNAYLLQAEKVSCTSVLRMVIAIVTCYTAELCWPSKFDKIMQQISSFICDENKRYYEPAGLHIVDPAQTGLLHLEIIMLH
ncbi:Golgin subfamily A member 7/ERF4 family-domain-containing protein [Gaertneriomyces semiglobifer]|nr:Golgin subfamily A member 7/ERF4 family-domain-containing protein [Gaertneriomyces semiglobifer]